MRCVEIISTLLTLVTLVAPLQLRAAEDASRDFDAAVASIVEERERNGAYTSIDNFMERINFSTVNRKCIESIALAGGFDSISGIHRSIIFAPDPQTNTTYLEMLTRYGQRIQAEKQNAQQSLFGGDSGSVDIAPPKPPVGALEWSALDTLKKERDVIGLYLSSHPLNEFDPIIKHLCKNQVADLSNLDALMNHEVTVAGMVTSVQNLTTKTGKPWGKFTLEDYNGSHEFALFGKDYENFRQFLYADYFVFLRARVQEHPFRPGNIELKINSITQLSEVRDSMIKTMTLHLHADQITKDLIQSLETRVKEFAGSTELRVRIYDRATNTSLGMSSKRLRVIVSKELVGFLDEQEINYTIS